MLIVPHNAVAAVLDGRESDVLAVVRDAYLAHEAGLTAVKHSTFLRLPGGGNRIIGLPAFVGGKDPALGMKWIASFPANTAAGRQRASAVIVLNSPDDGRPYALVEGALISARRTAASAALAAALMGGDDPDGVTLFGCGVINMEVLRFLRVTVDGLRAVTLYDKDDGRAGWFAGRCARLVPGVPLTVANTPERALSTHRLVSVATTAAEPHIGTDACRAGTTVLHLSLRDLYPEAILGARNVVDDPEHVCREGTSLERAASLAGDRGFIDATIGELLAGSRRLGPDPARVSVFSPFGLGALDIALARFVYEAASRQGLGVPVPGFLPDGMDFLDRSRPLEGASDDR